jgi:hypothetical protein
LTVSHVSDSEARPDNRPVLRPSLRLLGLICNHAPSVPVQAGLRFSENAFGPSM